MNAKDAITGKFFQNVETQLQGWETELDQLEDQVSEVGEDPRTSYDKKIELLRNRIEDVWELVYRYRDNPVEGKAWDDARAEIDRELAALEEQFDGIVADIQHFTRMP